MKGCLVTLVSLGLAAFAIGGLVGMGARMLATPPEAAIPATTTAADGSRAQQKLFDVARAKRLPRPVVLTEAEVNAVLAHHLVEARGVRLNRLAVRLLGADRIELTGQAPLRQFLDEAGLPAVAAVAPTRWLQRPVWVHVSANVRIDPGPPRQLRLDVAEFALGGQRLPARLLRLLVDPAALGLLRWPVPEHVEAVGIEPGRVVIRGAW
jgi:hypothetical protein